VTASLISDPALIRFINSIKAYLFGKLFSGNSMKIFNGALIFSAAHGAWVQPKYEEVLKASKVGLHG